MTAQSGFKGDMWADPNIPDEIEADDGDDDYIDIMDEPGSMHPSTIPQPPPFDEDGHPFVAVVDISGVHHLPVITCQCPNQDRAIDISYLEMGLLPASFEHIQTLFTIELLKDYRLSNLECKTSAYQYYQKLRRLTSPAFPKAILNHYRELQCLSREYCNMKLWKIHGRGHKAGGLNVPTASDTVHAMVPDGMDAVLAMGVDSTGAETGGDLAAFCPACPQPGVNLPKNWKDDPQR